MMDAGARRWGRPLKGAAHATGNILIGLAVGLLAYYGITNLESRLARRTVTAELRALGPIAQTSPEVVASVGATTSPMQFEGWEQQDAKFWNDARRGDVIGRIVISKMGLDSAVVKGTDRQSLERGPGWITTTSPPGPNGNCAISGHRTTFLAPFRHLDRLKSGDLIELFTPYRRYRYRVRRSFRVRPWQVEVIAPTTSPILTLTACDPPYSARYRLIVQSDLIEARPLKGAPTTSKP